MDKKRDWVKIIAICFAILFFILWKFSSYDNDYKDRANQDLSIICQSSLANLHYRWQSSFDTLLNCYKNAVPECQYTTPVLNNETKSD